MNGTEI